MSLQAKCMKGRAQAIEVYNRQDSGGFLRVSGKQKDRPEANEAHSRQDSGGFPRVSD